MEVNLENIDEERFDSLERISIFERNSYDRRFALLTCGERSMKLSWQSDIITPVILKLGDRIYFIGIDLNYAIVDFNASEIELKEHVDTFILSAFIVEGVLIVASEMKLVFHDLKSFKKIREVNLPDIYVDSSVSGKVLTVECINGDLVRETIKLQDVH